MVHTLRAQESTLKLKCKKKSGNSLFEAIKIWVESLPAEYLASLNLSIPQLLTSAPKRWVVYYPMVLLPAGSFDSEWNFIFQPIDVFSSSIDNRSDLSVLILSSIARKEGKKGLTHLAINSGIPRYEPALMGKESKENVLRTPSGLIPLYGDFGPALSPVAIPCQQDFDDALWVSTKQNGITQIWAPRYTMFSRGNFKEKQRLIKFHTQDSLKKDDLSAALALDLYAGIGYFVFSYVKMGIGKVICWEINPWSLEGLRRGAIANKWSIKFIDSGDQLLSANEKIIVFPEDNRFADEKLIKSHFLGAIKHVNCGLLPTSVESWKTALQNVASGGWLHLHENVDKKDIPLRRVKIEETCQQWLDETGGRAQVIHVELVKTFAPQIWHCVFDVYILRF
ncbi:tRNA wybutosine-synthesizing protein 2 [Golovinomyces cichoracearum]|uniref:tRNA wybutosine-synthesizing protein 2 n=1 Tax=Golovinomyces cichoracearum TaxID=62708 RepID=A0A420IFX5_9PEZI|nr:tRNA wybutosine-synthesizing protein 2 [Golovinomyces cichoracearum]